MYQKTMRDDINLGQEKQQSFSFKVKGTENKTSKYILPSLSLLEKNKGLLITKSGTKTLV